MSAARHPVADLLIADVEEMVEALRRADKEQPGPGFVVAYWLAQEGYEPPEWWAGPGKRLWRALAALVCDAGLMGPGLHDGHAAIGCRASLTKDGVQ